MKNFILISDFCLTAKNRGTAALGYGALSFLCEKGYMSDDCTIASFSVDWSLFRKNKKEDLVVQGKLIHFEHFYINVIEYNLCKKLKIWFKFLPLGKLLDNLRCIVSINGGDGFSDIYGDELFNSRNPYSFLAMRVKAPLVLLPQTIGPFQKEKNLLVAKEIMEYAEAVYVRDKKFTRELEKMGIKYELTKDLSAYMKPEPWDIDIKPNSIGINVSGLAYSNNFLDLAGQFDAYPELIDHLICHFRDKGLTVYLIPHAYGYNNPEENNDDMLACRQAYHHLKDKSNVVLIDKDLTSPQIKYVISNMRFFCGTRMHANFAAIYTNVPVFGLAYSYKFAGAFEANGLSADQTYMINNMSSEQIDPLIKRIERSYDINTK